MRSGRDIRVTGDKATGGGKEEVTLENPYQEDKAEETEKEREERKEFQR